MHILLEKWGSVRIYTYRNICETCWFNKCIPTFSTNLHWITNSGRSHPSIGGAELSDEYGFFRRKFPKYRTSPTDVFGLNNRWTEYHLELIAFLLLLALKVTSKACLIIIFSALQCAFPFSHIVTDSSFRQRRVDIVGPGFMLYAECDLNNNHW